MNTRYTTVNLDVSQQGSIPSITLSQYDVGVGLGFYIMDGGLPYTGFVEGDTVTLSGTKPSGVGFTVPAYYKSENLCSFRVPQAMTTEAGTVTCEITITKANNISVSTANFYVEVEAAAHAHEVIDEDIEDFSLIADQVGEYKATAVRAAQQAAQSATDAASSASGAQEYMEAAQSAASSAIAAKDDIQEYIDDSEAWARGTRGGTAVSSSDQTYENNSKYYAEQSSASAIAAGVSQGEAAASAQEAAASVVGAVKYTAQSLTTEQKAQARTNIGAASPSDIPSGTVRYDASQSLTDVQKTQALTNIGGTFAGSVAAEFSASTAYAVGDTVMYQGKLYEFTSAHVAGAWNASHVTVISIMDEVSDLKGDLNEQCVMYTVAQNKTDDEKHQAEQNIGLIDLHQQTIKDIDLAYIKILQKLETPLRMLANALFTNDTCARFIKEVNNTFNLIENSYVNEVGVAFTFPETELSRFGKLNVMTNNVKRGGCVALLQGEHPLKFTNGDNSQYYPIPIPEGSTLLFSNNSMSLNLGIVVNIAKYDSTINDYVRVWGEGWHYSTLNGDTYIIDISKYNNGEYYFVVGWQTSDSEVPISGTRNADDAYTGVKSHSYQTNLNITRDMIAPANVTII